MKKIIFTLLGIILYSSAFSQTVEYPTKNCKGASATPDDLHSWCHDDKDNYYNECDCAFEKAMKSYNKTIAKIKYQREKLYNQVNSIQGKIDDYGNKAVNLYQGISEKKGQEFETAKTNAIEYYQKAINGYKEILSLKESICILDKRTNPNTNCSNEYAIKKSIEHYQANIEQLRNTEAKKEISINTYSSTNDSYTNSSNNNKSSDNKLSYEERKKQDRLNKAREIEKETQRNINRIENATKEAQKGIDNLFSNWAKERDFANKVNSLRVINSKDVSGIIEETKYKALEIDKLYSQRKSKLMNMSLDALKEFMNSSKNESELITNTAIGVGLTVLTQVSADKQRKKLINELEEEKNKKLNELAGKVKAKYQPVAESYLQKAKYAVTQDEESYYLKQYEYNKCMIDNALSVVLEKEGCTKPVNKSFTKKTNYTGQDYYNTYLRKKDNQLLSNKSEYFLELAIDKEPNNTEWLYETTKVKVLSLKDKVLILKKCVELDNSNMKIKNDFDENYINLVKLEKSINKFKVEINNDKIIQTLIEKLKFKYDEVKLIEKNLFIVKQNELEGVINSNGDIIIPIEYRQLIHQYGKFAALKKRWGIINKSNEIIIPFKQLYHPEISKNNYFIIQTPFGYKVLNKEGKKTFKSNTIRPFNSGISLVGKGLYKKYINEEGKIIYNPNITTSFKEFSEGLAAVGTYQEKNEKEKTSLKNNHYFKNKNELLKYGYINNEGNLVIDYKYSDVDKFKNSYARVSNFNFKVGMINKNGEEIIKLKYDKIGIMSNILDGYVFVNLEKKWGLLDSKGKTIIPIVYDTIYGILKSNIIDFKPTKNIYKKIEDEQFRIHYWDDTL